MKRNLELAASLIVLAIISFAVLLINRNEREEEMQAEHYQEVLELHNTISSQQMVIDRLNAHMEKQNGLIEMQDWQLRNLDPSEDR